MRFLVDESTGASVARALRELGHDVAEIAAGQFGATDSDVLEMALSQQRILVTNDKDFGEMVYRSQRSHHGVLFFARG
jgi:predicted nuclease of predicted toxin-antitoxin system